MQENIFHTSEYLGAKLLCQKADKGHCTVSGKADINMLFKKITR
jgi:hypothetical protein